MNDSVDVKRHVYLRTIAKLKVHAEFFFWRLCHRAATHQHSFRVWAYHQEDRRVVSPWILPSGGGGGGGFKPGITHNFPDTDGRRTYNICLASPNQICTFFKVTQLL